MTTPLQSADAPLAALLRAAAIAPLDDIGWLRVTGSDRLRWLNGMVTNYIAQLTPGTGCYNFALNAHLDRFIVMDDVELADIAAERRGLLLAGPNASRLLAAIGLSAGATGPLQLTPLTWRSATVDLIHAHSPLVPKYEIWADAATIAALTADLIAAGATAISPVALEDLRILEGTPRYGTDITDRNLPQETGQSRALHFTKGCYLGQEIVERIHSRGGVHRAFSGFVLAGPLPTPGTVIEAESTPVGELTSVAAISLPDQPAPIQLALGIVRSEALANAQARNLTLTYPGGAATPIALPYAVP
jgi:aminomethyltransferase